MHLGIRTVSGFRPGPDIPRTKPSEPHPSLRSAALTCQLMAQAQAVYLTGPFLCPGSPHIRREDASQPPKGFSAL